MSTTAKVVIHAMTGLVLSGALLVLAVIATVVAAIAGDGRAEIPGVFEAWMEQYEGSPSLSFIPHAAGMGVVVVILTLAYLALALGVGRAVSRRVLPR